MYVYKTTNLINGLIYIGISTKNSENHFSYLGSGVKIKEAVSLFGKNNFKKEILDEDETFRYCDLQLLERFYIAHFDSKNPTVGYNISDGGDGNVGQANGMYGKNHNEESVKKISMTRALKKAENSDYSKLTDKGLEKMKRCTAERNRVSPTLPNGHSEETKKQISETLLMKFEAGEINRNYASFTEERKQEYSERFSGKGNPFYGKKHSPETIELIKAKIREKFPPVDKLDIEGNIIKSYISIYDVREDGYRPDLVKKVLKGENKLHAGFIWRYPESK